MRANSKKNTGTLVAIVVISIAVTGYFIGLQAPMNATSVSVPSAANIVAMEQALVVESDTILATEYSNMKPVTGARSRKWRTSLADLKSTVDPMAEVFVSPEEKLTALKFREQIRAFNGAPPTIPHPVDQKSTAACIACHGVGAKTESLRIPKMSHQLLANCTQCHVENQPQHMAAEEFRGNDFTGLAAPTGGPRAFPGAPPQIPHSTWMRSDCLSCHGFAGQKGIRTTHPWRQNCQQCHAPSATLDQTLLVAEPQLLPPPQLDE